MTNHNDDFDRMARAAGAALRRPAPEGALMRVRAVRKRRQVVRTTMVGVAGLAILVAGVSLAKGGSDDPAGTPTTVQENVRYPLGLSATPQGYALRGQGVRPSTGESTRGAVFVKRDGSGTIVERVVLYLRDDIYRGAPGTAIPIPANLAPAEGSELQFFTPNRTVRLSYGLFERGHLILEAYHEDRTTSGALTDAMQAIAASLVIAADSDLVPSGDLPEGWSLATSGPQPWDVAGPYVQAFEVDQPDGGNKVMVENWFVGPGFPYWMAYQTLQPVTVRGHEGYVTFSNEFGPDGTTATPTNESSMLIWEEAPGHWVTLWAGGMTTEQAVAIADQLLAVSSTDWVPLGDFAGAATGTTTTTLG